MNRFFVLLVVASFLGGCSESPAEAHRKIIEHEATVETYEALKASYSDRKRQAMDEAVSAAMQKGRNSEKQIQEMSLKMFHKFATCKKLMLLSEEVSGNSAVLTYRSSDTCFSEEPNVNQEIVYMVNEGGWKIDEIEIEP